MRRGVSLAVVFTLLCAAGATGCFWKAWTLRSEAAWLLIRAGAQAEEYVSAFDGTRIELELATFEQRRDVLEEALLWQRGQQLFLIAGTLGAFAVYLLSVLSTVRPIGAGAAPYVPPDEPVPGAHPSPS